MSAHTHTQNLIQQTLAKEEKEGTSGIELAKITGNGVMISQDDDAPKEGEDLLASEFREDKNVEVKEGFLKRMAAKCGSRDQPKKPIAFESNPNLRIKNTIKRIVNGRFVLTLMTFVTIFALIGVSPLAQHHFNLNLAVFPTTVTNRSPSVVSRMISASP